MTAHGDRQVSSTMRRHEAPRFRNLLVLLPFRFLLVIVMGWYGFYSLRKCIDIYRYDNSFQRPPYNPNILPGQLLATVGGIFCFAWNLATLTSITFAHGGTLIVIELIDILGAVTLSTGLALQGKFLPRTRGVCRAAPIWQVPHNETSMFMLMAGSQANTSAAQKICSRMVMSWGFGIGAVVVYSLVALSSLISGIRELGDEACYDYNIHYDNGERKSFSKPIILLFLPLFTIEWTLEIMWNIIPTCAKVAFRYLRRATDKLMRYTIFTYRLYEQDQPQQSGDPSISKTSLIGSLKNPGSVQSDAERCLSQDLTTDLSTKALGKDVKIVEVPVEVTDDESIHAEAQPDPSVPGFLHKLPLHLLIDLIFPYLHHIDLVHLSLVSRASHQTLVSIGTRDRRFMYKSVCREVTPRSRSMFSNPPISRTHCFGCGIPVCTECSQFRELSETPMTTHARTCQAVCRPCLRSTLREPQQYYGRQRNDRSCDCDHSVLVTQFEREINVNNGTAFTYWPVLMTRDWHSAVRPRQLCRDCAQMDREGVKRTREERFRRKCNKVHELGDTEKRCAYECWKCHKLMDISDKKLPVMFFICKKCDKECRYAAHDQWTIEDALEKRSDGPLDPASVPKT